MATNKFGTDINGFTHLVKDSQAWFKDKSVEYEHLLDYIIFGDVSIPDTARVLALAIATVVHYESNYGGRFLALNRVVECDRCNLIPLMLQWFDAFIHSKCKTCNETICQMFAYNAEFLHLKQLFLFDPSAFYDANRVGMSPFRILYRNFLRLAFNDCHFEEKCPAHLYAYGENPVGNLGIGSGKLANYPSLVELPNNHQEIEHVSLGRYHSLFLIDGKVFACGSGRGGRLGLGDEADVALPQPVIVSERVICVAAGLSHSVICTKKKIYTFGSNGKLQLGMPNKKMLLSPTVAFRLKNDDNFVKCLAADSFSAAITEGGRWYIAGTDVPFVKRSFPEFYYCSQLRKRNAILNSLGLAYVLTESPRKVFMISKDTLDGPYTVRCDWICERCLGIFECSGMCVLIECNVQVPFLGVGLDDDDCYKEHLPTYLILYEYCSIFPIERLLVEFIDGNDNVSLRINEMTVAKNGVFLLTDVFGLVYEGNLYEPMRKFIESNSNKGKFVVIVNRIIGLAPVKKVFISPDGKNKALLMCDLILDRNLVAFKWFEPSVPSVFISSVLQKMAKMTILKPSESVEAICMDENQVEIARFTAYKNHLIEESTYCSTYFSRWLKLSNNKQVINFFSSVFALDQFIRFCYTHEVTVGLSSNQLLELLLFADEYCCDRYFDQVLDTLLFNQLDISIVRDLCVMTRYIRRPRLVTTVHGLCAVFFPLLFDRGLISELFDNELVSIRKFYMENGFYGETASARFANGNWIEAEYFIIDEHYEQRVTSVAITQNSFVNEWLLKIATMLEERGTSYLTLLLQSFRKKTTKFHISSRKTRYSIGHSEKYNSEDEWRNASSSGYSDKFKNTDQTVCAEVSQPTNSSASEATQTNLLVDLNSHEANCKNDIGIPVSRTTVDEFPSLNSDRGSSSAKPDLLLSTSGTSCGKAGWNAMTERKTGTNFSFREILERELAQNSSSQVQNCSKNPNDKNCLHRESRHSIEKRISGTDPWAAKKGWNNVSIADQSVGLSFKEIINQEVAQLNETKRVVTSHVLDIETEELAINELIAVYEADAARNGMSATISAERMHAARSNPLWSARN